MNLAIAAARQLTDFPFMLKLIIINFFLTQARAKLFCKTPRSLEWIWLPLILWFWVTVIMTIQVEFCLLWKLIRGLRFTCSKMLPELVIGGFHLMKRTEFSEADTAEVTEIANRLRKYPSHFATCHCTGLPAFNQMKKIMGDQLSYVRSGDEVVTCSFRLGWRVYWGRILSRVLFGISGFMGFFLHLRTKMLILFV